MPNARSASKSPIVIYVETSLLDAMRQCAKLRNVTVVDLQAEYLDRHCMSVLDAKPKPPPRRIGR